MTVAATLPRQARNDVDSQRPYAFFIEQECGESGAVVSIATLFLTNRQCPWRCIYCDLWKNTLTETVPPGAVPAQIDHALARLDAASCSTIKLYNAGSFFDPKAIPPEDFPDIAQRVTRFGRVIVESHPALVGDSALRFRDLLSTTTKLEVAMGLEIADDEILARLNKRMTLEMFARAAEFLNENEIAMRAFVIVKPPFVRTEAEALGFAKRSIEFAFECGARVVSLIPARFGTEQLDKLAATGDFAPPHLDTVEAALDAGLALKRGRVLVDLWDLQAADSCPACFSVRRARLEEANLRQVVLPAAHCAFCRAQPAQS
jgi:radical SAM enzyme (TIGR01210 family)